MSKVIFVQPDAFMGAAQDVAAYIPKYNDSAYAADPDQKNITDKYYASNEGSELNAVARPLNGITAKPNTPAFVQVVKHDGTVLKVFNHLGGGTDTRWSGDYFNDAGKLYNERRDAATPKQIASDTARAAAETNVTIAQVAAEKALSTTGRNAPGLSSAFTAAKTGAAKGLDPKINPKATFKRGVDENGQPTASYWTDWLLQTVRETRMEKTQVVETFGDTYFYALGQKPRALVFQGLLMNTVDYNWRSVFWAN
jgi:hypothetical protein